MTANTKNRLVILAIVMALIVIVSSFVQHSYNKMVKTRSQVESSWADVEAQYQRRADLIPNLVSSVKGYASHESSTLEGVVQARAKATQTNISFDDLNDQTIAKYQQSQSELSMALGRLMAISESYPDLKASESFLSLQTQLEGTENRIATARRKFNEQVKEYNTYIQLFPSNIIAGMFNFTTKSFFASDPQAATAPEVKF